MRSKSELYKYQLRAIDHAHKNNGSAHWVEIGGGKTIIGLTVTEELLDSYSAKAALVVATKKIAQTVWEPEGQEWEHTKHLRFSKILGTPKQRLKALHTSADVYLTNYEQLKWLVKALFEEFIDKGKPIPFDILLMDEISKMKTATNKRGRAFVKILPYFFFRLGLTASPMAEGLIDLHGQYLIVDGGHRLGPNITGYRTRWFVYNEYSRKYSPRRNAKEEILSRIADITVEIEPEEYKELPPLITIDKIVTMPDAAMKKYKEFEDEYFAEIDGEEIEAFNAGAKSIKCRQLANGAVYSNPERTEWATLHDEKLDVLGELIDEIQDQPLLVCYQFKHDKTRIKERFPEAVFLDSSNVEQKVKDWNAGKIKLLVGHPMSMGHGLNLQHWGFHICWFGIPWSLDLYEQAIGRIRRNGQKALKVFNHRLLAAGTIESEVMAKVVEQKGATQRDLRDAIKRYRDEKGGA